MTADLFQRVHAHLAEYFDEWGVPEDFCYIPQPDGQEPGISLHEVDAKCYVVWLKHQGYITKAEERWLWADIAGQQEEA